MGNVCDRCGEEYELDLVEFHQDHCTPDAAHEAAVAAYREYWGIYGRDLDICENRKVAIIARHMRAFVRVDRHVAVGALHVLADESERLATLESAARAVVVEANKVDAGWLKVQQMKPSAILIEREYLDALSEALPKGAQDDG